MWYNHKLIAFNWHFFWLFSDEIGATLDKKGASITWDSKAKSEDTLNADRLHLRQILLGHTAEEDEYNVIEVSQTKQSIGYFYWLYWSNG